MKFWEDPLFARVLERGEVGDHPVGAMFLVKGDLGFHDGGVGLHDGEELGVELENRPSGTLDVLLRILPEGFGELVDAGIKSHADPGFLFLDGPGESVGEIGHDSRRHDSRGWPGRSTSALGIDDWIIDD